MIFPARALLLSGLIAASACGADESAAPPAPTIRLTILRAGASAPASLTLDAFGQLILSYNLRDPDGRLLPAQPVQWTSTQPGVARIANFSGLDTTAQIFVDLVRNGTAKLIAQLGDARDTLAILVQQRAVAAFVVVDTITTLIPGAVDLDGLLTYDTLRLAVYRTDSNGSLASVSTPIIYASIGTPVVTVIPEANGDTIRVIGIQAGSGRLTLQVAVTLETVATQAADRFRVARVREAGTGALIMQPDSVVVPAGAAVVFQNDAERPAILTSRDVTKPSWRVGPIPPAGAEAQIFKNPGRFLFGFADGPPIYRVVVTP